MTTSALTLRDQLENTVGSSARRIIDHPFHQGIRDGSLPPVAFDHYTGQDSHHVLPSYGRALARCAALVPEHRHARLLSDMGTISLGSAANSARGEAPPITPTTLAITGFYAAATLRSPAAAVGALLPSAWLWLFVTDDWLARHDPSSRYAEVITSWHPGSGYRDQIEELLTLVDEVAAAGTARERGELVRNVDHAARLEWLTVDAAWRLETWPY